MAPLYPALNIDERPDALTMNLELMRQANAPRRMNTVWKNWNGASL